jgi:hypothetical protein
MTSHESSDRDVIPALGRDPTDWAPALGRDPIDWAPAYAGVTN